MDTPILVAIISGIFGAVINPVMKQVVIPMIISLIEKLKNTFGNKRVTIFLQAVTGFVLFFVFFGILAYFLIKPTFLSPCPLFASTSVTITSPAPESKVPLLTTVQGTACNIHKEFWLLVETPDIKGYFPQSSGPIVVSSDGKWSASASIGTANPADVGKGYVVYAALVDKGSKGSDLIHGYFQLGQKTGKFKPLDPLPEGITLMSQVHVVRAPLRVTITSPAPESKVPLLTIVQGSADYIPPDTQLWLLVVPDGGTSFFPQPGPIVVSSDGKWSASAYIGLDKPGESGKGHVVYAALADQEGSTAIQNYFKSRYKPLDPLPRGIQLMSQVHVVRE